MMRGNRRRRVAAVAGMAALLGSPFAPSLGDAGADTCAQVRVYVNGGTIPVGSCHPAPCPAGHHGAGDDLTVFGSGAGITVCVVPPVASP